MATLAERVRLIAIVGPTAVGKTELSLRLASALGGEIVSADSRQVYRYMDIGTAKPSPEELASVPHHLIDVVDPDEEMTLAHYKRLATDAIEDVHRRGRLPLLVGGTGLYVRTVLEGWTVPRVPPDTVFRAQMRQRARLSGHCVLHAELAAIDPTAAKRIDARNVRRVIRALEVHRATGKPISQLQTRHPPDYAILKIGLTRPRPELYGRIDIRVDAMMEQGLVGEVRGLLARGYGMDLPAMSALGYRQLGRHLKGETSLSEAVALVKRRTRQFVRRQYNWFRLADESINWHDMSSLDVDALVRLAGRFAEAGAEATTKAPGDVASHVV